MKKFFILIKSLLLKFYSNQIIMSKVFLNRISMSEICFNRTLMSKVCFNQILMPKVSFVVILSLLLCSCVNDLPITGDMSVKLFVEVEGVPSSKTVTSVDGSVVFAENDVTGMFMQNVDNPVAWTYRNGGWETEITPKWENRTDDFEFLAYYPCGQTEGVIRTAVPMPDLSVQTGDMADIGKKDFLVGRCVTSYSDNNGTVSFSGENPFKHVYSLLHLNIVSDDMSQSFSMKECTFSGEGIVTPCVYSFDRSSEGMKKSAGEEVSELHIDDLSSLSAITVLINPVALETPVRFTLRYTFGDKNYEASADLGKVFAAGSFSKVTLRVVDGKLVMTGNTVTDWDIETLDDIVLNGSLM